MTTTVSTYPFEADVLHSVYELDNKRDLLKAVYVVAGKRSRNGISLHDLRGRLSLSPEAAERACDFWVREGVLRWSPPGYLALTYAGVMRAERLERGAWSLADL